MTLSAEQAAERLGVSRATLYAYVSRGLLRSEPGGDPASKAKRYWEADVNALLARKDARRDPQEHARQAAQGALHWGQPVLESGLTLIEGGRLSYRGQDATRLAETASVEQVAALLWTFEAGAHTRLPVRARMHAAPSFSSSSLSEAYAHALTHAAAHDLHAAQTGPAAASRVLNLLYASTERFARLPAAPDLPLHDRLARAWRVPAGADLLRRALILTADHELNVSAFTARTVASGGASLHHATLAALCALQGPKHGLATVRAYGLISAALADGARTALREHGADLPGFGHALYPETLYPDGDPRAAHLLGQLHHAWADHPAARITQQLTDLAGTELGARPNVDLALAATAHALGLNAGQALALFALGRAVGWLAHALEALQTGGLIRPRARYVGGRAWSAP